MDDQVVRKLIACSVSPVSVEPLFYLCLFQAWSPTGERLAVGCDDGKVHICRHGAVERAVSHEERVCSLSFHPSDHVVASGAMNGKIRIIGASSAECIARGEEVVTSATWNTTGDALAMGCDGGTLRVFYFQPKSGGIPSFGSERSSKVALTCQIKMKWTGKPFFCVLWQFFFLFLAT